MTSEAADYAQNAAHDRPTPAPAQQVFQHLTGYIVSSAMNVAVKLDIPDRLASGPRTAAALAREANVNEDALARVLRALASVGVFAEDGNGRFCLTPVSDLLRSDHTPSMKSFVSWLADPFHFNVYADLMHAVRTGGLAVEQTYGEGLFDYLAHERELSDVFQDALTSFSRMLMPLVLNAYDFSGIGVLVDVAGGHGHVLMSVLERYPSMRGVLFDVAHVIDGARPSIASRGLDIRCETIVGDFFTHVPGGGDAYLMKHIIHDWNDERALIILRNIHTALRGRPHGRLLLLENILAPANEPDLTKLIDLEMLVMSGGRERSEAEFRALLRKGGFELTRIVKMPETPVCVIEAEPR